MNTKEEYTWGSYELTEGKSLYWKFGPLNIWCKQVLDELWIAFTYNDENQADNNNLQNDVPDDLNWQRWMLKKGKVKIEFRPAFPGLPVVVKPEYALRVRPNAAAKVYVRVPMWIQFYINKTQFTEIPIVQLSKTWFGNFVKGELCYWISSSARRVITPDLNRPYLAICPIDIKNKSEEEMLIEKICLRVTRLSVFRFEDQHWGSETKAHFKGHEDMSDLEVSNTPPADVPKAVLVASSRDHYNKSFTAKTFMSIKELSGLDFFNW